MAPIMNVSRTGRYITKKKTERKMHFDFCAAVFEHFLLSTNFIGENFQIFNA